MLTQAQKAWQQNSSHILLMLLGLVAGLYFFTFNVIGLDFAYFPGDLGDGRLNLYFLEHAYKFFTSSISSFWDAPFMYPEQNVIAYSDNLLGSAPIYAFFRLIGFDTYLAYQWWFILVSALNYITAFYLLKYIFKDNHAAVLGAFIFAFSIALQSQLTHAQTFPRYPIPLTFLMAVKFSHKLNFKYFLYTLLFLVYQIYCGVYLGLMLAIPIGIYLLLIILKDIFYSKKVITDVSWLFKVTVSVILSLLALIPLMLPYTERKSSPSFEHFKQISNSIPTTISHFFSQRGSLIWDFLSKTGQGYEASWNHQLFAGGIASICLITSTYWLFSKLIKGKFRLDHLSTPLTLILTSSVTFFLFVRFQSTTAYTIIYYLPGFNAMRSLTRIINIELVFFAIATALVYIELFKKRAKFSFFMFLTVLTLIIIDNYFYSDKSYKTEVSIAKKRIATIESAFTDIPHGSVFSYEPSTINSSSAIYQIDAMLLSQRYDLITLNGYTATCPGDYGSYWDNPNATTRNHWLDGKEVTKDTLYIIKNSNLIKKIPMGEL